jgi:hypothetical protein
LGNLTLPLRRGWDFVPSITVLFTEEADPRLPLVGDATAFWNNAFSELATQFRLGGLTHVRDAIPVEDLKMLAANVVGTGRPARELPESVRRIKGNIVVALSDGDFISFAARPTTGEKALVAIKDHRLFPLTLPNVARNVIAHELGHVIGLPHNDDPTTLMCGRPAPCRPDLFTAEGAKYFPLSDVDNGNLRRMYPAELAGSTLISLDGKANSGFWPSIGIILDYKSANVNGRYGSCVTSNAGPHGAA